MYVSLILLQIITWIITNFVVASNCTLHFGHINLFITTLPYFFELIIVLLLWPDPFHSKPFFLVFLLSIISPNKFGKKNLLRYFSKIKTLIFKNKMMSISPKDWMLSLWVTLAFMYSQLGKKDLMTSYLVIHQNSMTGWFYFSYHIWQIFQMQSSLMCLSVIYKYQT